MLHNISNIYTHVACVACDCCDANIPTDTKIMLSIALPQYSNVPITWSRQFFSILDKSGEDVRGSVYWGSEVYCGLVNWQGECWGRDDVICEYLTRDLLI